MRPEIATTPPCPPPTATVPPLPGDQARPACWQEIRDELFLALSNRGLNNDAASAAAERGADAAIVEARLVTLAEAQRWGRPYVGTMADEETPEYLASLEVETDVLEIATLSTVATLAMETIDLTRSTDAADILFGIPRHGPAPTLQVVMVTP